MQHALASGSSKFVANTLLDYFATATDETTEQDLCRNAQTAVLA